MKPPKTEPNTMPEWIEAQVPKFTEPENLRGKTFLSKKAGSFSGVPQRTVQTWTEKGLVIPDVADTTGTGKRRQYSVLNCIEIGVLKSLAMERLPFGIIKQFGEYMRQHRETLFGPEAGWLVLCRKDEKPNSVYIYPALPTRISFPLDLMEKGEDRNYDKIVFFNLGKIKQTVLSRME